jgi:hypothetical protein
MPSLFSFREQEGAGAMKVAASWVEIMTALVILVQT